MSRTYGGYLFICKVCGEKHLLDSGKPYRGIRLPCIKYKYSVEKYNKSELWIWHGSYYDVANILVQEEKE